VSNPTRPIVPRRPVPDLSLALAGGGSWRLSDQKPQNFTMLVVYRGLHCPACKSYLRDLESKLQRFRERGVTVIAASSDNAERALAAEQQWGLDCLPIAFGLPLQRAREWGLFISSGRGQASLGIEEPAHFVEPGLFLIRPDRTLYFASIQSMPFALPPLDEVLEAIEFAVAEYYPARGEVP
jgi:peroxiredoxin